MANYEVEALRMAAWVLIGIGAFVMAVSHGVK